MRDVGWWIVTMTVLPSVEASDVKSWTTSAAILESSPEVGSSHKTHHGLSSNSRAIETRLRCPPDKPRFSGEPTRVSAHSARPSCVSMTSTRATPTPRSSAEYVSVSRGVSPAINTSSCGMRHDDAVVAAAAAPASGSVGDVARSEPVTVPRLWLNPPMSSKSVVLPDPEGPMRAEHVPASNAMLTSSRICFLTPRRHGAVAGSVTEYPTWSALSVYPPLAAAQAFFLGGASSIGGCSVSSTPRPSSRRGAPRASALEVIVTRIGKTGALAASGWVRKV
mmetsp:Transcript_5343/g.22047  ORF Transcript_5343/g.22047 Transcript_5343/m.22047 type:complete len:279 (+) Transcript_5343:1432-2268(+)